MIEIETIAKLELKPGDTLVFMTPQRLSERQRETIVEQLNILLLRPIGLDGVKAVVLDGGAKLAVLSPPEPK